MNLVMHALILKDFANAYQSVHAAIASGRINGRELAETIRAGQDQTRAAAVADEKGCISATDADIRKAREVFHGPLEALAKSCVQLQELVDSARAERRNAAESN